MSLAVRTASIDVFPVSNQSKDGDKRYNSVDLMEPVSYNVSFSPEGGRNPRELEKTWVNANQGGEKVNITFTQKKGRFGQELVIYDIKPVISANKG